MLTKTSKNRQIKKAGRTFSMQSQIYFAIMLTFCLVCLIFILLIFGEGTIQDIDAKSYITISNLNSSRAEQIASTLNLKAHSLWDARNKVQININELMKIHDVSSSNLQGNYDILDEILNDAYIALERFLTVDSATGAFIILEAGYTEGKHAALYIKTANPDSTASKKSDILILRGATRLENLKGIGLQQNWQLEHTFPTDDDFSDFYTKPLYAHSVMPEADVFNLGYWRIMPAINIDETPILTYSVPLVTDNGDAIGVIGFEISLRYLSKILPVSDLPYENSFYAFGKKRNDTLISSSLVINEANAVLYLMNQPEEIPFEMSISTKNLLSIIKSDIGPKMFMAHTLVELYGKNSIFRDDGFFMFAFAESSEVHESSMLVTRAFMVTFATSLVVAFIISFFVSKFISEKIEGLVKSIRLAKDKMSIQKLPKTNIKEIDDIVETIETMSADIANNAAKMSAIIDLVGLPIGVFEVDFVRNRVYLTKSLYKMLDITIDNEEEQYKPLDWFETHLPQYKFSSENDIQEKIFLYETQNNNKKWLQMNLEHDEWYIYGVISDITGEVDEKERLIYESTYDPLTKLLNRNSYYSRIKAVIDAEPEKIGVLIFLDLDQLKSVNDNYGHDLGDKYIQLAANALSLFSEIGGVVARLSGDEFIVYLHGGDSKEDIRTIVDEFLAKARSYEIELPDGKIQKLQFSAGVSYYPHDSNDIEYLVKFADYAMYEVKHSSKGGTHEFDKVRYERNSFIIDKSSYITRFLKERALKFAFQPLVNLRTTEIQAYEAIMRPQTPENYSPNEILALAKNEGKLGDIEKIVFESFCLWAYNNQEQLKGKALSFNTIAEQPLFDDTLPESVINLIDKVIDAGIDIVMEISVNSSMDRNAFMEKIYSARKHKIKISIDNYSGELIQDTYIKEIRPDFIKISIEVVRDLNDSSAKQQIFKNVKKMAEGTDSQIIAEGIETVSELTGAINMGVQYGQGFYFCPPEFSLLTALPDHICDEIKKIIKSGGS